MNLKRRRKNKLSDEVHDCAEDTWMNVPDYYERPWLVNLQNQTDIRNCLDGGVISVTVIIVENGIDNPGSNTGCSRLRFT